jgi:hypothetical protein
METITYNDENLIAIQNHANLYPESLRIGKRFQPELPDSQTLQVHVLSHPNQFCIGAGMSREVNRIYERKVVESFGKINLGDRDPRIISLNRKFDGIFKIRDSASMGTVENVTLSLEYDAPIFELEFDCRLALLRRVLDKDFLVDKQLSAIIGYYLNCWDNEGRVIFLKDGFEKIGGKLGFQNILILAGFVKDNSKLKDLVDQIISIDRYREQIGIAAQDELDSGSYRNQIINWAPDADSSTPYSPKDLKIIRTQYQNPTHANSFARQIERDSGRILKIL